MTDKITTEDRHIEAAIREAGAIHLGWTPEAVRKEAEIGAILARSFMAHAETMAMVEKIYKSLNLRDK